MQRLIKTSLLMAFLCLIIFWTGCGGKQVQTAQKSIEIKSKDVKSVPDWFLNLPEDPNYLYAAATATSKDLQMAIDTAKHEGTVSVGQQLETRVSGLFKRFREETGVGEESELLAQTTAVSKAVVSESLNGCKAKKQEVFKEGILYRTYVLMEMPIGMANQALLSKIKAQNEMYTRFRASQAFDELEQEVEKYEQIKKEETP
jgi:hypothetical protein